MKFLQLDPRPADMNERNDCAIRATVCASAKPYAEVHAAYAAAGRTARRGTPWSVCQDAARALFHKAWTRKPIRLLGVYAQQLEDNEGQTSLLVEPRTENWRKALAAVDKIRGKYGDDGIVSLAAGMPAEFRPKVHENPENLPGKDPQRR